LYSVYAYNIARRFCVFIRTMQTVLKCNALWLGKFCSSVVYAWRFS